jgi:hypothetical protein
MGEQLMYAPDPAQIALANDAKIREFFDVAPKTLIEWHDSIGFPISWPNGRGPGKTGYVPLREARAWLKRKASL